MQDSSLQTWQNRLLQVGHWEGISYLLLLGLAMPLKYIFGWPLAVSLVGGLHGFLFVGFAFILLYMFLKKQLSFTQAALSLLLSFVPFGTFFLEKWVLRK